MNLAETHDLLTLIAAYDNRRFDDATVFAWHEVLATERFGDCRAAVVEHFGSNEAYLMPVHVKLGAAEVDRDRRRAEREAREQRAIEAERADPTRQDRSAEVYELLAELRARLPQGDPDKLRYGHKHWRLAAEHARRFPVAEPNPDYDPSGSAGVA